MNNIQELALELVQKNISKESQIHFKDRWFAFYDDKCGQRGHYVLPYTDYGNKIIKDSYIVKRVLSFENEVDKGKDGAVLGVLNLTKCKALSIKEESIEFENFTFYFKGNPNTQSMKFVYE